MGAFLTSGCKKQEEPVEQPTTPPPVVTSPPPEPARGDAYIEGDRIIIARPIYYDTDKDLIRPESYPVIDAVANVVKSHPEIKVLYVEGHTDNQGNFDYNRQLSEERADAVIMALAARGVTTPMQKAGYGYTNPLCMTPDEACLQLNRRVEFRIKRD